MFCDHFVAVNTILIFLLATENDYLIVLLDELVDLFFLLAVIGLASLHTDIQVLNIRRYIIIIDKSNIAAIVKAIAKILNHAMHECGLHFINSRGSV